MKSPRTGVEMTKIDNYWYDKTEGMYYIAGENNQLYPARSVIDGAGLEPLENNIWYSKYSKDYQVFKNGTFISVMNPVTHTMMGIQSTGNPNIFIIKSTGHKLIFNEETNSFVPDYLPDDILNNEPAHVEGNYLVGNNTGTKVKIGENGDILTPTYLKIQQEVANCEPKNGIWQGHRFRYNESNHRIYVAVPDENGTINYMQGVESTRQEKPEFVVTAISSDNSPVEEWKNLPIEEWKHVEIDEYDRQLLVKIESTLAKKANQILDEKEKEIATKKEQAKLDMERKIAAETEIKLRQVEELARNGNLSIDEYLKMAQEIATSDLQADKVTTIPQSFTPEPTALSKETQETMRNIEMKINEKNRLASQFSTPNEKERMRLSETAGNSLFGLKGQAISDEKYIEKMKEKTANVVGSKSTIMSTWIMNNEDYNSPLCCHELVESGPDGTKPLGIHYFNADTEFVKTVLEPAIIDYAQSNAVLTSQVTSNPQTDRQNNSSYISMSDNNILQIENITPEYANTLSDTVQYISNMSKQQSNENVQNIGRTRTLSKPTNGYINILELIFLLGVILGISYIIYSMILNI